MRKESFSGDGYANAVDIIQSHKKLFPVASRSATVLILLAKVQLWR
jgi:hypothetical protein